jgi:hypothetical protein
MEKLKYIGCYNDDEIFKEEFINQEGNLIIQKQSEETTSGLVLTGYYLITDLKTIENIIYYHTH